MGGVTNLLIEGAQTAAAGDGARYQAIAYTLRQKHETAIRALLASDVERIAIHDEVEALIDEFGSETVANLLIAYGYARTPREEAESQEAQEPVDFIDEEETAQ